MKRLAAVFLALLLAVLPAIAQPSMAPQAWRFLYSPNMPASPSQGTNVFYFMFPQYAGPFPCRDDQACPGVHYLVTPAGGSLLGHRALVVTGRIVVTGHPIFDYRTEPGNTCISPASAHLFIQRRGDDLSSDFYRWWSNPLRIELKPGPFRIVVLLTPSQWSSVFGHHGDANGATVLGFHAALANVANFGMTFGGGCFDGHGVNIRGGTAKFVVTAFRVNR